ncbi:uncharacterized protein LOC115212220 [Octopus sinensis]|uniref:Uncharacterized protein LOC115212220 n=1 Tax=Octopus sinensis TaxID=2607531 RepID=A0A6P7SER8_9MOLL|nr:uncharacterized protein LOC115212220 [Octopus sinensis]
MTISWRRIVGTIFSQEILNLEHYCEVFDQLVEQLSDNEKSNAWLQQDSATYYVSNHTLFHLRQTFDHRFFMKVLWPPWPPDLMPLDFFLFLDFFLSGTLFAKNPHTLDELCTDITDIVQNISREVLINAF